MRRAPHGGQPLRGADVRSAVHADFARAPGLRRHPFDRVIAVVLLVAKGVKRALGLMPPARVLDDHGKTVFRRLQGIERRARQGLVVGRALQQGGEGAIAWRQEKIGV